MYSGPNPLFLGHEYIAIFGISHVTKKNHSKYPLGTTQNRICSQLLYLRNISIAICPQYFLCDLRKAPQILINPNH
jgi:hypothetical protein